MYLLSFGLRFPTRCLMLPKDPNQCQTFLRCPKPCWYPGLPALLISQPGNFHLRDNAGPPVGKATFWKNNVKRNCRGSSNIHKSLHSFRAAVESTHRNSCSQASLSNVQRMAKETSFSSSTLKIHVLPHGRDNLPNHLICAYNYTLSRATSARRWMSCQCPGTQDNSSLNGANKDMTMLLALQDFRVLLPGRASATTATESCNMRKEHLKPHTLEHHRG